MGNEGRAKQLITIASQHRTVTKDVLFRLEDGFMRGLNQREACVYANISPQTLQNFIKIAPMFKDRIKELKAAIFMKAKLNIYDAIDNGCMRTSTWFLEKRAKDFGIKINQHITEDRTIVIKSDSQAIKLAQLLLQGERLPEDVKIIDDTLNEEEDEDDIEEGELI